MKEMTQYGMAPVWFSASESHLKLIDKAFNQIKFMLPSVDLNIRHRRLVGALSYLFKLSADKSHFLYHIIPNSYQSNRAGMSNLRPTYYLCAAHYLFLLQVVF